MIERTVAILSGIGTQVVDRFARQLRANAIEPAFVEIKGDPDQEYFDRLLMQSLDVIQRSYDKGSRNVSIVLISALSSNNHIKLEAETFFPAVRRLAIKSEWRNNPKASGQISSYVIRHAQNSLEKAFTRSVARNARFLLPIRNANCKSLLENYKNIYDMTAAELARRVEKDVVSLRKRKALRIGGIDFDLSINNGRHPVRRVTTTSKCDFHAAFRFGASIEDRLEFDITCENGLKGKQFCQCDGTRTRISIEPTHLNMRINDDHASA